MVDCNGKIPTMGDSVVFIQRNCGKIFLCTGVIKNITNKFGGELTIEEDKYEEIINIRGNNNFFIVR